MKTVALVATEATKDLWAAFIRTMGTPLNQRAEVAHAEANQLVNNWLAFDEREMKAWYAAPSRRDDTYVLADGETGKGQTVDECMKNLGVPSGKQEDKVKQLERDQKMCLFNITSEDGYADLYDTSVHMPFNWKWKTGNTGKWLTPPADWTIPNRAADTGVRVEIKSAVNNNYIVAADGVSNNQWVYVRANYPALGFVKVPDENNQNVPNSIFYRVINAPDLFLSYNGTTGAVKLWNSPNQANYVVQSTSSRNLSIKSVYWNQYMWLSKESPYITREGNPANQNAQWIETSVSGTDIGPIWQYTGTACNGNSCPGWQMLDNNAATVSIAAGGGKLYQLHNTGKVWRFTGTVCSGDSCPGWQMLDNNPATIAIAAGSQLYQLHDTGKIWKSTGTACSGDSCPGWQMLDNNPATIGIYADGNQLYQLHNTGKIWKSTGATCSGNSCPGWQMLDNNPNTGRIAAGGGKLYQLHMARTPMTRAHICYECK